MFSQLKIICRSIFQLVRQNYVNQKRRYFSHPGLGEFVSIICEITQLPVTSTSAPILMALLSNMSPGSRTGTESGRIVCTSVVKIKLSIKKRKCQISCVPVRDVWSKVYRKILLRSFMASGRWHARCAHCLRRQV